MGCRGHDDLTRAPLSLGHPLSFNPQTQLQRALAALLVSVKNLLEQGARRVRVLYQRSMTAVVRWAAVVWNYFRLGDLVKQARLGTGVG